MIRYSLPEASAPGCVTQACDLKDNIVSLQVAGFVVPGVSKGKGAPLQNFSAQKNLGIPFMSDSGLEARTPMGPAAES